MFSDLYPIVDWMFSQFVISSRELWGLGWIGIAVICLPLLGKVVGIFKKLF